MVNRPLGIPALNPTATFSDDVNQNSLILKMTGGSVSFRFMGDADSIVPASRSPERVSKPAWGARFEMAVPKAGYRMKREDAEKSGKRLYEEQG